ncbi:MAG TPA: nucleoside triphosphate pyrophosphohydrolase, partial [Anaeromyxobacteraceae bacterium]|nr:nucleoside triphosphate pyrophosphohydrolase [Anaeromyxobacteraceae bacterium]
MPTPAEALDRLLSIMSRLRGEGGCPWDREQTLASLKPYLLEETYEVLEAIDAGDPREHCEELGDLLLQIVFQAQLASESHSFSFGDVAEAISKKLIFRHPHVFAETSVGSPSHNRLPKDSQAVVKQWEALKRKEEEGKGGHKSVLDGVPRQLPALARAQRLTEKASRIGFDWPDASGARAKVNEELGELDDAIASGEQAAIEAELGDTLFALANLARKLAIAPEEALRGAVARFIERFGHVERELERGGTPCGEATIEEMDAL